MQYEYVTRTDHDQNKVSCDCAIYRSRNRWLKDHGVIPELELYDGVDEAIEKAGL